MAAWMAEQVGPTGHVVASDIDTGYLQKLDLPNLEVREHDILEDPLDELGPGSFDLVGSRLALFHLVGRQEQAVRQMVNCLRPGGWLIDEDVDWGTCAPVDPGHPRYEGYRRVWRDGDSWTDRGYDKSFGRNCRRCSSGAASRTFVTRRPRRSCAGDRPGHDGGPRPWR